MAYFIGEDSLTPTWGRIRRVVVDNGTLNLGDFNTEYVAPGWFITIEGNGFLKGGIGMQPSVYFQPATPPVDDYFSAGGFADYYPEQLLGRTVTTSSSSFTIVADAFTIGQAAGTGGTAPITGIEWFQALP